MRNGCEIIFRQGVFSHNSQSTFSIDIAITYLIRTQQYPSNNLYTIEGGQKRCLHKGNQILFNVSQKHCTSLQQKLDSNSSFCIHYSSKFFFQAKFEKCEKQPLKIVDCKIYQSVLYAQRPCIRVDMAVGGAGEGQPFV